MNGQDDDIDERYRRASTDDPTRPAEAVRRAVFAHAAELAAERSAQAQAALQAAAAERPAANQRRWRPAAYGGLAAAALAALLVVPHFLPDGAPPRPALPPPASPSLPKSEQLASASDATAIAPNAPKIVAKPPALASAAPAASAPAMRESAPRRAQVASPFARLQQPAPAAEFTGGAAGKAAPLTRAAALRQAAQTGDLPRLSALLEEQIDVDARDSAGRSALLLAVLANQGAAVDALLAHGADPNATDAAGDTPLAAAELGHQAQIIAALRRAGAR